MKKKVTKKDILQAAKKEDLRRITEWSINIRNSYGNKCAICGGEKYLNAHHIIPREIKEFRYDPDNGISLCSTHHKWDLNISPHRNPFVFFVWFMNTYPTKFTNLISKYQEWQKTLQ